MRIVAFMATYPGRGKAARHAIESIAGQVDRLTVTLNEYATVPPFLEQLDNVDYVLPETDLKDVGKFTGTAAEVDAVILCDDDIVYPPDYTRVLVEKLVGYQEERAVVGLHGVTYSDFFNGEAASRTVFVFAEGLSADTRVNQLGTGTVACFGFQLPELEFMRSSARFVDVRFAIHCERHHYPRICMARKPNWLQPIPTDSNLFEAFTRGWPDHVVREVQEIAGYHKLAPARDWELLIPSATRSLP